MLEAVARLAGLEQVDMLERGAADEQTSAPDRSPNYDRRLTRPIKLADGTWLKTIKDAADYFAKQFSTVTAWGPLEIAVEMLITAGESGKRDDIDAATKQVEIVLRGRRLI